MKNVVATVKNVIANKVKRAIIYSYKLDINNNSSYN